MTYEVFESWENALSVVAISPRFWTTRVPPSFGVPAALAAGDPPAAADGLASPPPELAAGDEGDALAAPPQAEKTIAAVATSAPVRNRIMQLLLLMPSVRVLPSLR
jgi:hypothetical protein